jgi:putative DNA primase/helicase
MTPLERTLQLLDATPSGDGWSARCPSNYHTRGDRSPSLSIGQGDDGRVLVHCHAGCETTAILAAVGLTLADLFVASNGNGSTNGKAHIVATYDYLTATGDLAYHVHRYHPKDFRQQAPDGSWRTRDIPRVLYHLPEVLAAVGGGQAVAVTEGEKDADLINHLGTAFGVATCNPGGAGKWKPEYTEMLTGATRVAVIADNDEPGRAHAATVASSLVGKVGDLRVFLPTVGKDVGEHLQAHKSLVDLQRVEEEEWRTWTTKGLAVVERRLLVVTDTTVERRKVGWAWEGWLPLRKLIALDGDPDQGKSTMVVDLAARISSDADMPDGSLGLHGDVLLLSGEDDIDDTTGWRLDAAGANRDRVHHVQATLDERGEAPVTIPQDVDLLEEEIERHHVVLVVIDVLAEYLDSAVNTNSDHQVRRALLKLRQVASRTGCAIIFLRHLKKDATDKAIYRGGGSIGIIGAARAGWIVAAHPENPETRVLVSSKMNLATRPTPLGFRLLPHALYPCAYVDWQGQVNISADQLLSPSKSTQQDQDNQSKGDYCENLIRGALEIHGEMWSNDLYQMVVVEEKVGKTTYETVKARLTFAWRSKMEDGTPGWKVRLK